MARHIGISNYSSTQMHEAAKLSAAPLVTNQVEYHPWLDQTAVLTAARQLGMSITGYYAMADGKSATDPVLAEIGAKHGKSAAQVALRWQVQQPDMVVLSKTAKVGRVPENLAIFDFELSETEMAAIEAWITDGALRAPGAAPAPMLNNPPRRPQPAVYRNGTRLDGTGPLTVAVGDTLVLRHSVQDFETPDAAIPFAGVQLTLDDGRAVVLDPANDDPQTGRTTYDAAGPMGIGDRLNWQRTWTVPATLPLIHPDTKVTSTKPAAGTTLTMQAFYLDQVEIVGGQPVFGMFAFDVLTSRITIP